MARQNTTDRDVEVCNLLIEIRKANQRAGHVLEKLQAPTLTGSERQFLLDLLLADLEGSHWAFARLGMLPG